MDSDSIPLLIILTFRDFEVPHFKRVSDKWWVPQDTITTIL